MVQKIVQRTFLVCILLGIIGGNYAAFTQQPPANREEIVLTTYYPVPYGDYQNLRLWPSAQKECNENKRGTLYYDDTANKMMVCTLSSDNMTYAWQVLGEGLWTRKDNVVYSNDPAWNVGIGTDTPQGKLEVNGGNLVVQNGAVGIDTVTPATYGGQSSPAQMESTGYIAVSDVWLKSVNRWASQQPEQDACPEGFHRGYSTGPAYSPYGFMTWGYTYYGCVSDTTISPGFIAQP